MSWSSELISTKGKHLGLSNAVHNADMAGRKSFSFALVLIGPTFDSMAGYNGKYSGA